MTLLLVVCGVLVLGYIGLLQYYLFYWRRTPSNTLNSHKPFCSVVIAARNEEATIQQCLDSVIAQSYPADNYEILVVDDHSRDSTPVIVQQFSQVRLLQSTNSGKKHALSEGITQARGEIIVVTDADCQVPPEWLEHIASAFSEGTHMVTGPVLLAEGDTVFARFQGLEIAGFAAVTAAGITSHLHNLANGANMAFRKSTFLEIGSFHDHLNYASGDDVFLVQEIAAKYPNGVRFIKHPEATVFTYPQATIRDFINQRLRWASKNTALPEKTVYAIWAGIGLTFTCLFFTLPVALLHSVNAVAIVLGYFVVLCLVEYLFLREVAKYYSRQGLLKSYLLSFTVHTMYIVCMTLLQFLPLRAKWKGRPVH